MKRRIKEVAKAKGGPTPYWGGTDIRNWWFLDVVRKNMFFSTQKDGGDQNITQSLSRQLNPSSWENTQFRFFW